MHIAAYMAGALVTASFGIVALALSGPEAEAQLVQRAITTPEEWGGYHPPGRGPDFQIKTHFYRYSDCYRGDTRHGTRYFCISAGPNWNGSNMNVEGGGGSYRFRSYDEWNTLQAVYGPPYEWEDNCRIEGRGFRDRSIRTGRMRTVDQRWIVILGHTMKSGCPALEKQWE